jgi:hypothetical protein
MRSGLKSNQAVLRRGFLLSHTALSAFHADHQQPVDALAVRLARRGSVLVSSVNITSSQAVVRLLEHVLFNLVHIRQL